MNIELEERVRHLAYAIWELEGRPDGRAHAHWERALKELDGVVSALAPVKATDANKKAASRSTSKTQAAPPKRKSARAPQVTFN